jgi:hypothetical protein
MFFLVEDFLKLYKNWSDMTNRFDNIKNNLDNR